MDKITYTEEYLNNDWRVHENANSNRSYPALRGYVAGKDIAKYTLSLLPDDIVEMHNKGYIHLHDLSDGIVAYCAGWSLQDLILYGLRSSQMGTPISKPAKHFSSLLGQIMNFFFLLQSEFAGAQSFSSFDTFLSPYVVKDNLTYDQVKQELQTFIYNMNQPLRASGQSPFTNLTLDGNNSIMDTAPVVYAGKITNEYYRDYKKERLMVFKAFTEILTEGDGAGQTFPFPIPTLNIDKNFNYDSEEFEVVLENTKKYGNFYFANFVNSVLDPAETRSMCPLDPHEKVIIKEDRYNGRPKLIEIGNLGGKSDNIYTILSNGKYVHGKFQKHENQKEIIIHLVNGHEIRMSENHLNFVKKDKGRIIEELIGDELQEGYYLPFTTKIIEGEVGNYELGYLIGAYAGDGSIKENRVTFSLNDTSKVIVKERLQNIIKKYFSNNFCTSQSGHLVTFAVNSEALVGYINQYVKGQGRDKYLTEEILNGTIEFRQGIIEGYCDTDGGSRDRIYTSSRDMVDSLNFLASSLGLFTTIGKDNREGRLGKGTVYSVLIHKPTKTQYQGYYFMEDGYWWVKIDKIEHTGNTKTMYCFEIIDDEPMFNLGNGLVTHNCRLNLNLEQIHKLHHSSAGLFGSSDRTGSVANVTINLPLLAYESQNEKDFFKKLEHILERIGEYHKIKRELSEKTMDDGLTPYGAFYLKDIKEKYGSYFGNHFSTIGIVGMNETIKNLFGSEYNMYTHKDFAAKVLDFINDKELKLQEKYGFLFNLEESPSEGSSYRLAMKAQKLYPDIITAGTKDKPYFTNGVLPDVDSTSDPYLLADNQNGLLPKFTSGSVVHFFIDEQPSTKALKAFIKSIIKNTDIPYFTITPTFSVCPIHGYIPGKHEYCPYCDLERIQNKRKEKNNSNISFNIGV